MLFSPFMLVYLASLVFIFGACVGSFLNVCIYRIPRDESVITPRSHCPHCNKMIAGWDNIPLFSYLILRGKCRKCGGGISIRYFTVELLTAVLFVLVWLQYGLRPVTPVYWLIVGGLVLGTFVDFDHMIIPDRVSIGGIIAGLLLSPLIPSLHGASGSLEAFKSSVIGFAAGFGSLYMVGVLGKMVFKKDAMGFGDVKLLGGLGALLGWQAVVFIIMISSVAGSVVGLGFVFAGRRELQSRIPYGPYLALAAVVWLLGGHTWFDLYLSLFSNI